MTRPKPQIRPADAQDVPAMTQIVAAAYQRYVERIGKPPAPMLDDYRKHVRANACRLGRRS